MLAVTDLHAYYGKSHILHGVNLRVGAGEIVSLLGRNGAGRSTTIKAIMGQVDKRLGALPEQGDRRAGSLPRGTLRAGLRPQAATSFRPHRAPESAVGQKRDAERALVKEDIPAVSVLRERAEAPAGVMSGGEQQMLTLCRTLMGDPRS